MSRPEPRAWQPDRVSYRRFLLDEALTAAVPFMRGTVVDLGGKRIQKRGAFRPQEQEADRWIYVNLARDTRPDVLADVGAVPLRDGAAHCVVCTEVLEHLPDPAACVAEGHRLLRVGGVFIASVPFLYPIHADPADFQRYTVAGLHRLFATFGSVKVEPMGGFAGVIGLLLELGLTDENPAGLPQRLGRRIGLLLARRLCRRDLRHSRVSGRHLGFTTGYFVVATK